MAVMQELERLPGRSWQVPSWTPAATGDGVGPDRRELRKKGFGQPPAPLSCSLPHPKGLSPQKEVKGAQPGTQGCPRVTGQVTL